MKKITNTFIAMLCTALLHHLKKGESKPVKFILQPDDLLLVNDAGEHYAPVGKLLISVGGDQPVKRIAGVPNVIQKIISIQ